MSLVLCDEALGHNNKEGYLSKKNRKGYYNSRYFQTLNEGISYWIDKASFDRHDEASSTFEIKDIKAIEKSTSGRVLSLIFGDKFRIDLRCEVDECKIWFEILTAKKAFYSVKELLTDLDNGRTRFVTRTFSALMVIPVTEQNEWIIDHLNDTFESAANDAQTTMLRSNPMWVIKASRMVVEEFISTSDECALEMESRNPKLSAHCRGYMHRYADMMKGRLALELSFFMEAGNKQITEMGERALCAAISLMNRLDDLRAYTFLPHDLVNSLISCLFSVGELMSALLNLSIQRIEAWFCTVLALPPIARGSRLTEINTVLLNALKMIDFHAHEDYDLYRDLLVKVAMSLQLNFSDQLLLLDLSNYDEVSLLSHVKACHSIVDHLPSHFDISRTKEGEERKRDKEHNPKTKTLKISNDKSSDSEQSAADSDSGTASSISVQLSPAAIDSVRCACLSSARIAIVQAVQRVNLSVQSLVDLFFCEGKNSKWIGGEVCRTYLDRLEGWLNDLLQAVPSQYVDLTKIEAARVTTRLFLKALIKFYHENRRSKFSAKGAQQVLDDMRTLSVWLMELFQNVSDAVDEQQLLLFMDGFVLSPQGDILQMYALSLQTFGIQYALELYDLLRLSLKMRADCTNKCRKGMLALCAEFYVQLQSAVQADSNVLGGGQKRRAAFNTVFSDLCPKVGLEHCTGKKWSIEQMSDPVAVRTLIARFVTETCQAARKRERDRVIKDEEESKREADIAAARTLASSMILQSSPRKLRLPPTPPPPPPTLPPRQTFQRVPSSRDSGAASTASVGTTECAAVRRATSIRADQKREPQLVNPFGEGDEDERHIDAGTVPARELSVPRSPKVKGRENQSLPLEAKADDDNDEEEDDYIDEVFECDQQEDQGDADVAWGAPSMEEKQLTDEVDQVTAHRWRQKGYGSDRYGDRSRSGSRNAGNPFGDSDSDD